MSDAAERLAADPIDTLLRELVFYSGGAAMSDAADVDPERRRELARQMWRLTPLIVNLVMLARHHPAELVQLMLADPRARHLVGPQ